MLCFFLTFSNAQEESTEIVKNYIENFNKKDSIATLNSLHKRFEELWQNSVINESKKEYAKQFTWSRVMNEYEEIEIISATPKSVVVNSVYFSDLDRSLGKMPYKCKKKFIISKGKIIKIISLKNKGYDLYQSKRKRAYVSFKNWLYKKHRLRRNSFKMNHKDAKKMKSIVYQYMSQNEIVER